VSAFAVFVNGRSISVERGATIADLIALVKLATHFVVVEHNGEPLLREEFSTTELLPGDTVEIAHMVGGG
jgi:sulfur carrier protein